MHRDEEQGALSGTSKLYTERRMLVDVKMDFEMARWVEQKQVGASIEVQKRAELAEIETSKVRRKAEILADVQVQKELQRTVLSCTGDGKVILQRAGFGERIHGELPIRIEAARCYSHSGDIKESAMVIVVQKENGDRLPLFWNLSNTEDRHIRRIFEGAGISFGFGRKKEMEVRRQVLQLARNVAISMELPESHGWYRSAGGWKYAFPEEITWREVSKYC